MFVVGAKEMGSFRVLDNGGTAMSRDFIVIVSLKVSLLRPTSNMPKR
jgi:hypothetical protein